MIQITDLTVKFGNLTVLKDVNLSINGGERVAIIGKNGSGKTTFIETVMGLNKISKGKISIDPSLLSKIKAVFQDVDLDNELRVLEIMYFYSQFAKIKLPASILEKYEISHVAKKRYKTLSGGEKQKFKLMMCLELKPKLIILDEISTSLDYQWRFNIVKIIKDYMANNSDVTLLLVSHDPEEIKKLCNKYYLVANQKITQIDDISSFFENIANL